MTRTVYIQHDSHGQWLNPNCYASWYGFDANADDVRPFTYEQMFAGTLQLTRETIVHGGVLNVLMALRQIGVRPPENIDLPLELHMFRCRQVSHQKLSDVRRFIQANADREHTDRVRLHIKPLRVHKAFDGHVVESFRDLIRTASLPGDMDLLTQEVVDFRSEYRVFVSRSDVVGMQHYRGDPLLQPDVKTIREMVKAYSPTGPVAHAIDVGVVIGRWGQNHDHERTLLVEVNDAFALGCYGLDPSIYVRMIEDRWDEMVAEGSK